MPRRLLALALSLTLGAAAQAQPVEVAALAAPDAFSTPGRDTGLPADLWRGSSIDTVRAVLPLLAEKPLSPAAARLARRVLATGAPGPEGAAGDAALLAARANALLALGDLAAANLILERAPAVERSAELSRAAAEAALLAGDDARACRVAEALGEGRSAVYWLRLRAFCQHLAGQAAEAQLTFDLAQAQARDAVYGRLMAARLAGSPPGAASLRNGLDLALSRALQLNLASAKPSPAVAAALAPAPEGFPEPAPLPADEALSDAATVLLAAIPDDAPSRSNAGLGALPGPVGRMPAGRGLALDRAVASGSMGETALLVLWAAADAGAAGPAVGDRARLAAALWRVGLKDEAVVFIAEGLAGLK
jgi:hypothetical protein